MANIEAARACLLMLLDVCQDGFVVVIANLMSQPCRMMGIGSPEQMSSRVFIAGRFIGSNLVRYLLFLLLLLLLLIGFR